MLVKGILLVTELQIELLFPLEDILKRLYGSVEEGTISKL